MWTRPWDFLGLAPRSRSSCDARAGLRLGRMVSALPYSRSVGWPEDHALGPSDWYRPLRRASAGPRFATCGDCLSRLIDTIRASETRPIIIWAFDPEAMLSGSGGNGGGDVSFDVQHDDTHGAWIVVSSGKPFRSGRSTQVSESRSSSGRSPPFPPRFPVRRRSNSDEWVQCNRSHRPRRCSTISLRPRFCVEVRHPGVMSWQPLIGVTHRCVAARRLLIQLVAGTSDVTLLVVGDGGGLAV